MTTCTFKSVQYLACGTNGFAVIERRRVGSASRSFAKEHERKMKINAGNSERKMYFDFVLIVLMLRFPRSNCSLCSFKHIRSLSLTYDNVLSRHRGALTQNNLHISRWSSLPTEQSPFWQRLTAAVENPLLYPCKTWSQLNHSSLLQVNGPVVSLPVPYKHLQVNTLLLNPTPEQIL